MHAMHDARVIMQRGRRWAVTPAAEPLLADGWPVDDPDRLALVKRGRRRSVHRLESGGRAFYVKTHERTGLVDRLRVRLGLGPGRREWEALVAARDAGLAVPEPVAVSLSAPETLITEAVPDGRRLDEYLFARYYPPGPDDPPYPGARPPELVAVWRRRRTPAGDTIDPRALAYLVADLVARLDEADLYLPDLHPGNLLLAGEAGRWRLVPVDLAEAVRPAPPEAVLQHLVRLEHFFEPIASAAERLRCLARLRALAPDAPDARAVARATAIYRRRFYPGRDRRTRRRSKYFQPVAAGPWRGWATGDWAEAVEAMLRANPDLAPPAGAEALKDGRSAGVWTVAAPDGRELVLKRDRRAGARGGAGLGRPTRGMAGFRRGHMLLVRGIATARPAAAVHRRRGGKVADAVLVTERVAGAQPLAEWLQAGPAPAARRHVTWALARMLRRLHDAGLAHRDLKAPNILVAPADDPRPKVVLVDLDGLRRPVHVSARRRGRDLMRLAVSLEEWGVARRTDRLRFLRTYLGRPGAMPAITVRGRARGRTAPARRLRRWWRQIARAAQRKRDALRRRYGNVERL
ncbi:MAG: hypothetical protein ISS74_03325 [Planctomycetes bacterium]|nr:hypothetical protein [Planctomycetota bacterium]